MKELIILLEKVPSTAWVAIFTAILTSSLTLVGIRYTNKANNERLKIQLDHEYKIKRDDLIRSRLEELYVESRKYMNSMVSYYLPYRQVMEGELTYNQALDLTLEGNYSHNPERVFLIMDMYFPELRESFTMVEKSNTKIREIQNAFKLQYKQGNPSGRNWLPMFQDALEALSSSAKNFEEHVTSIARKI
ncbi:hypothetical protein [Pseudoalteromonas maricaloris]|uniref:hypothetical protein n=1 Tax=Pseudoalteromonas maricaloris TaxID=184924 RepID=UPI00057D585A|nr:hypothetical protein [Pseudoalteromonas flavipulchra]KID37181.1 hypothetical protein QT15_07690 [Pseudoalteromonas flavipulchra NCIMB 2033 = ATCC BAA-314]MBD0782994.1 hypothetical protein [Pseudoalteromonas flavipulchra]